MLRLLPIIGLTTFAILATPAFAAKDSQSSSDVSAQRRARITVYPRSSYPGPYATRHCESWLAQENRPSGTVLTPQMRCWWR
jgi:hypothetical protein